MTIQNKNNSIDKTQPDDATRYYLYFQDENTPYTTLNHSIYKRKYLKRPFKSWFYKQEIDSYKYPRFLQKELDIFINMGAINNLNK